MNSYSEKNITIWSLETLNAICTSNNNHPIINISIDFIYNYSLEDFTFNSISNHLLSLWEYDSKNKKLNCINFNHEDIEEVPEIDEYFLSIENTQYFEYNKSEYIIIGTNFGNIILLSKNDKNEIFFIKKYMLKLGEISHMFYFNNLKFLIFCENKLIYYQLEKIKNPSNEIFEFLDNDNNKNKKIIEFNQNINSIYCEEDTNEILVLTDYAHIFYLNLDKSNNCHLMLSSNFRSNIIKIDFFKEFIINLDNKGVFTIFNKNNFIIFGYLFENKKNNFIANNFEILNEKYLFITFTNINKILLYNLENYTSIGWINMDFLNNIEKINHIKLIDKYILLLTNQNNLYYFEIIDLINLKFTYARILIDKIDFNINNISCKISLNNEINFGIILNDSTINIYSILKNIKIETNKLDSFNFLKYKKNLYDNDFYSKVKSDEIQALLNTINNYDEIKMTNEMIFSNKKNKTIYFSFSEFVSNIFIRDYNKKIIIKILDLNNYHICNIDLSFDEKYIIFGTNEGLIGLITRLNLNEFNGFSIEFVNSHYDMVNYIKFEKEKNNFLSCSYNENILWNISN